MIKAKVMIVSLVVVVIITVVFAGSSLLLHIASICIILRHMGLQLQRLSFSYKLLSKKVVLKTSDATLLEKIPPTNWYPKCTSDAEPSVTGLGTLV